MQRHVNTLPISNILKVKLVKNGIESVNELKLIKPTDLIKDYSLNKTEVVELYEALDMFKTIQPTSVYDLLKLEQENNRIKHISLLSTAFDNILGGGIPIGKINEICGAAGVGKTQLCMQLCVNVQIPELLGGLQGKAIYIDTEGSFVKSRLEEITRSTIEYLKNKFNLSDSNELLREFNCDRILKNIFYCRCLDHVQLISTINNVRNLIEKEPKIKLMIVDSLAAPFRFVDFKDSNSTVMKANLLNNILTNSYQLINKYNLAIVITNQMTTRISKDSSVANLVPALGESWAHSANLRLLLTWRNNRRFASLSKSSYLPDATIGYRITEMGLREMEEENAPMENQIEATCYQSKRKRYDDSFENQQ